MRRIRWGGLIRWGWLNAAQYLVVKDHTMKLSPNGDVRPPRPEVQCNLEAGSKGKLLFQHQAAKNRVVGQILLLN